MSASLPFFVYSNSGRKPSSHIILHPDKFKWLATNSLGLEITELISRGDSPVLISKNLASKYNISNEAGQSDVQYVYKQLEGNCFFNKSGEISSEKQ